MANLAPEPKAKNVINIAKAKAQLREAEKPPVAADLTGERIEQRKEPWLLPMPPEDSYEYKSRIAAGWVPDPDNGIGWVRKSLADAMMKNRSGRIDSSYASLTKKDLENHVRVYRNRSKFRKWLDKIRGVSEIPPMGFRAPNGELIPNHSNPNQKYMRQLKEASDLQEKNQRQSRSQS